MKSLFINAFFVLVSGTLLAQPDINGGPVNVPADGIIDGVFIQEHIPTKRMIPYEFIREADVIWSKRVWESIDMREKINHPMYFPFDEWKGFCSPRGFNGFIHKKIKRMQKSLSNCFFYN